MLGIVPVFTIASFLVGAVGLAVKTYYAYEAKMQANERRRPVGVVVTA